MKSKKSKSEIKTPISKPSTSSAISASTGGLDSFEKLNKELVSLNEQLTEERNFSNAIIANLREPMLVLEKILPEKSRLTDFEVTYTFSNIGTRIMMLNAHEILKPNTSERLILLSIEDITERKNIQFREKELAVSYKNLLLQTPAPICIFKGPQHVYTLANEKYLELAGKRDIIGKPIREAFPEIEGQGFFELLDEVYKTGNPFIGKELPIKLDRGRGKVEDIILNFTYQPTYDIKENIDGILVLAIEVTEQVHARKKEEVQNKLFRNMLMTSPGFVATLAGPLHVYDLVNEQYQSLFGERKIQGKPIMEALPELEGQGFDKLLDKVYNTGEPYVGINIPITLARNEDLPAEKRYFNFSYQPMYNEDNTIFSILVFGYEVTEQVTAAKKIEEQQEKNNKLLEEKNKQLENQNEELEEQNYFIETILNSSVDVIVVVDKDIKFIAANKKALDQAAKFYEGSIIGKQLKEIFPLMPLAGFEAALKGEEVYVKQFKSTVSESYFELNYIPLFQKNDVYEVMLISHDITNIIIKQKELERLNKELEAFTYVSSHDLQEPLRKIQTFAGRILEKETQNLSDGGRDMFRRIQDSAERMRVLIQDLLAFSRLNTTEGKFENIDLNKIIEEVKENLEEDIKSKHATIETTESCIADIIPFQFRQLLHNIIGNALKFSNPETPPYIKIKSGIAPGIIFNNQKLLPYKKYCHISISDNGIGFEKEHSEKIFEVFQRLHSREEYAGTGIGLSIVKRIVENHNGIITATSELGEGTKFDIYIPQVN